MRALQSWSSFKRLQWAFPVALTLHNLEEGIWLPSWAARHNVHVPWPAAPAQFRVVLVLLTVAAWVVTWFSVRFPRRRGWGYLLVSYTFLVFLNVWVPHVPASIVFRSYTPGVVTAAFLNLPVTGMLLIAVFRKRVIPSRAVAAMVFGIPLMIAMFAAVLFLQSSGEAAING